MSTYVYKCANGHVFEVREKFGSTASPQTCECGDITSARVPQLVTVLFKATGFTRASTNTPNQKNMSPWFGGPETNAPDYKERQEFLNDLKSAQSEKEKVKMAVEMEKCSVSAMESQLGKGVYDPAVKDQYFANREADINKAKN